MGSVKARGMILAAGLGTRLGDLGHTRPKPMLPICGIPLVRWAVLWLRSQGVDHIVINLHRLGDMIVEELGDGSELNVSLHYSWEREQPLGTGGALRHARGLLDGGDDVPIVVVNGKIMVDLDLEAVLALHDRADAEATMVLRPDPEAHKWGSFAVDDHGRVVRFLGRDAAGIAGETDLMFTGIHALRPAFLDRIPDEGPQCVIRTAYTSLFRETTRLAAHVTQRYWWEHSTQQRYLQGVFNVLSGKAELAHAPGPIAAIDPTATLDPTAQIVGPVWIGPGAQVAAGASVGPLVQLGRNAKVAANATVARAIVWPNARVTGDVHDVVVPA